MPPAIKIENLSKQYRLGTVGTGTLSHDLKRWWTVNVMRREDPYLKIGETNDREHRGESDYVWALRDINLEVEEGEVLGIIGKNGAGKSTLLKILSKVTTPTTGSIKARGRIASLLEVGTGFHPEMTGRENIFMNGAIMGMTKAEIKRKFDEIVDFAGVERYIDTPVKRYSSGMTVRLGFAVAAHLEPEILVVDEVLAVGDAEFQKKAIGKMQDVSRNQGRTVLFVSHNMAAVKTLCTRSMILEQGIIKLISDTDNCIAKYNTDAEDFSSVKLLEKIQIKTTDLTITEILINNNDESKIYLDNNQNELIVNIKGVLKAARKMSIALCFYDENNVRIATYDPGYIMSTVETHEAGSFEIDKIVLLPKYVNHGKYYIDFFILHPNVEYLVEGYRMIELIIGGYIAPNGAIADSRTRGFMFLEEKSKIK